MKLIKCGKLFDGVHEELQPNVDILVEDNRIKEVGANLAVSANTEVIDLSHFTVTPGMIDAHVHPDIMDWRTYGSDLFTHSDKWGMIATANTLRQTLRRGFTSIRSVGTIFWTGFGLVELAQAIEMGYAEGSRIVGSCHGLATTGSHGDFSQNFAHNPIFVDAFMNRSSSKRACISVKKAGNKA